MGFPQAIRRAYNSAIEGSADAIARGANRVGGQAPMRGALAGNPVGVMEEARKTLMAAYQSAKPAGKKALQKFLDDPEAFTALPEQVIERLAKGDASAVADAARFTSFPSRTAGQWVPPEGGIYSPEAIALGAGTAGAVGVGIAAGGAAANPKPSSPADLSDGLTGAPQDDITPEPFAGSPSRAAVYNNAPPTPLPPSRQARPGDTPLAPPEVMTQADIDDVNSLPPGLDPNHPRWGGGDPARVQQLMDANPGAFFGPGELTPEQEQRKKRMLSNRKSYYDQRYYAQTPDGKPVFQPVQEEFRVPYDPDKIPQATVPETGNAELEVPAYDKFEYTDDARRMRAGEDTASVMAGGSEINLSLSEQRQAQQLIRARAVRIARERGEDPAKVAEELMASSRLYRDPATGRLGLANGDDTFYKNRKRETDAYDLRREKVRQRGEMGLLPSQSAISNTVVDARRILNDPSASSEMRLAAEYYLNPRKFMVDYAKAQNPPKGDGSGMDAAAIIAQMQSSQTANAYYESSFQDAKEEAERAKSRGGASNQKAREEAKQAIISSKPPGPARDAAEKGFDAGWPVVAPPAAPQTRDNPEGKAVPPMIPPGRGFVPT